MDESEIQKIKVLEAQFHQDRRMQGYSAGAADHGLWGIGYFYDFLKMRDESDLHRITGDTMHKYQMHLFRLIGKRGKPLGLISQLHALVSVRTFFKWLVRRGFVLADPTAALSLPRQKKPLPKNVMSRREMERILSAPDVETPAGLRDRAMLELMYSTGLRNMEVRNLKLHDVNVGEGEVRVRDGKGGQDRVVPLGEVASKYVELYVKEARGLILGWKEDHGYLFLGLRGRRLQSATVNQNVVQRWGREAGLKKHVTAHGFRHTCATHLLRGRASLRHIQALLGHKSLESTQIYLRVEVSDLKREVKRCHPRERAQ